MMRDQVRTDAAQIYTAMARGIAQATGIAKELQGQQKTPTIAMMRLRISQPVVASQLQNMPTITVMARGHAHPAVGAKGQLAEEQMIKKKSYLQFIFFNSNK